MGNRLVSWQCKKQTTVSLSTAEAEYIAAASCTAQVLWIQNQLLDYGMNFMRTPLYIDNLAASYIIKNSVHHSRTKHIEIRHHFIRDCYEKNLIDVRSIGTEMNLADIFTKPLDTARFNFLLKALGMMSEQES